jgi:hypothetical protein
MAPPAATIGQDVMDDRMAQNDGSSVVDILPYRLRALRRRRQAARAVFGISASAAAPAPASAPAVHEADTVRAGIRHIASGRMTVVHGGLKVVFAMLIERAARGRGLLANAGLEAIVVDGRRQVFAGFWP